MNTPAPATKYNVGSNMVGFSVDDPEQIGVFDTVTEARDYLLELISEHCEDVEEAADFESQSADPDPRPREAMLNNTGMMEHVREVLMVEQPPTDASFLLIDAKGTFWSFWMNAGE